MGETVAKFNLSDFVKLICCDFVKFLKHSLCSDFVKFQVLFFYFVKFQVLWLTYFGKSQVIWLFLIPIQCDWRCHFLNLKVPSEKQKQIVSSFYCFIWCQIFRKLENLSLFTFYFGGKFEFKMDDTLANLILSN